MTLLSQIDHDATEETGLRAGLEFQKNLFWLRGGYQNLTSDVDDPLSAFSLGAGLQLKGWKVDYAWVPKGDLGDQHRIAVSLGFGLTPEERELAARQLDKAMQKQIASHAKTQFLKGKAASQKGAWKTAAEHFSQALSWDPNHKEAQAQLKLAQKKRNFAKASKHYKNGQTLLRKKQWLESVVEFRHTLKLVPTHKEAKASLRKAEKQIKKSTPQTKDALAPIYGRGIEYYLDGNYTQALTQWNKVLKKNPRYREVEKYIAKAEKMVAVEELKSYKEEQKTQKEEVLELSQQAYTYYMLGDVKHAIRLWERVLILNPSDQAARSALKNAKQKESLVSKTGNKTGSKKVHVLRVKAIKAYKAGQLSKSAGYWRRLLNLDPQNIWVKNNLERVERELVANQTDKRRAN